MRRVNISSAQIIIWTNNPALAVIVKYTRTCIILLCARVFVFFFRPLGQPALGKVRNSISRAIDGIDDFPLGRRRVTSNYYRGLLLADIRYFLSFNLFNLTIRQEIKSSEINGRERCTRDVKIIRIC